MAVIDGMLVCTDCGRGFDISDRAKYRAHLEKHGRAVPDPHPRGQKEADGDGGD